MTLVIELTQDQEEALVEAARLEGVAPNALAARVLAEHLPSLRHHGAAGEVQQRVLTLLASWRAQDGVASKLGRAGGRSGEPAAEMFREWEREDAALTEEQSAEAETLWESFRESVDAERIRAGMRTLF